MQKISRLAAVVLIGSALNLTVLGEEPPLQVFVLAGTSNMTGSGARISELSDDQRQPQKDVLVFQGGAWLPMEAGKVPSRGEKFGVEVSFGKAMADHLGHPIGLIFAGMRTASPEQGAYAQLVRTVQAAQNSRPIVIAGMAVQLYEDDARTAELAQAYSQNITRYIESARRDLGNPAMLFVKNQVLRPGDDPSKLAVTPQSLPRSAFPFLKELRDAEDALKIPGFGRTGLDDLPRGKDRVHYDSSGILALGQRHAATMIKLMEENKARAAGR